MQLLISDANILIDIEEGELVKVVFQLPYEFHTPDILFHEELEEHHSHLLEEGLQLSTLTNETMQYAETVITKHSNPSRNDCFALALAYQESCPLLTGDQCLRKAAESEGMEVMGTIWLINQCVTEQLFTIAQAKQAYQKMKDAGRRLPWETAEKELLEIQVTLGLP